jgi:hypothetical protein
MKRLIVSILAAGAATLGACATTTTDTAALSGSEMVSELAAVSQGLRRLDVVGRSLVSPDNVQRPVSPNRTVRLRFLHQVEQLLARREELREGLAARRQSLTADEIRMLIAEIDRELTGYEDSGLAPAGVGAGPSRPFLRTQYTGGDFWTPPDSNYLASRPGLESTGMRHSQWVRTYRLKKDREALWAALRTHAVAPL